jgi:3-oxoacyl-[acyl-carrier protein] reductase
VTIEEGHKYDGSVVVVTGSRKGLGRLLALHFLDEGARVIGLSRAESSITHKSYEHLCVDVGRDAEVRATFVAIARTHGRVDIAINNAGVSTSSHALLMPAAAAEEMVRTNFLGGFYVAREAAKLMRRGRFGRIINIGSMVSVVEPVGTSVYAAMKAASMTMTGVLAKEFADGGITVNTLSVSALQTDMLDQLAPEKVDELLAALPLRRLATPDDVFNVVDFFASRQSSYITAQTVFLGGVHA